MLLVTGPACCGRRTRASGNTRHSVKVVPCRLVGARIDSIARYAIICIHVSNEPPQSDSSSPRLESWKAIANYLNRDVRTVQRWERDEGLPVHRHVHKRRATVYAYPSEIEAWRDRRAKPVSRNERIPNSGRLAALAIGLLTIVGLGLWALRGPKPAGPVSSPRMIVVLPFEDRGEDPDSSLAEGLAEELGLRLGAADPASISVIARSSAMSFRDHRPPVSEIRQALGVDYVVDGSVSREGSIVRITAQLVDAASQSPLWSGIFEYPADDWLETQHRAASDILANLGPALDLSLPATQSVDRPAQQAVEHTILGFHYFDQFRPSTLPDAIEHFEKALAEDPGYVAPKIGLALSHVTAAFFGAAPAASSYEEANKWSSEALRLEPDNGDAVALRGWVEFVYRWNWDHADDLLRKGVELRPASPWTHLLLANSLSAMGRAEESIREINAAIRLDPLSPFVLVAKGYILANAGRYQDAVQHWLAIRERLGDDVVGGFLIGAYESLGDFDSATRIFEELGRPRATELRQSYETEGEHGYWQFRVEIAQSYLERYPDTFSWHYAAALTKLGRVEEAIEMLERGYHQRDPTMVFLPIYPLQELYSEPRFQEIVRRMDLPPFRAQVNQ